jgi:hypothetical protein
VGLSSHQILATSASFNSGHATRMAEVSVPEKITIRELPLRPRSGRFRDQSAQSNELDFDFESSSSSDDDQEMNSVDATKQRIKDLVKSFDNVSKLSANEISGLLVPVRRIMTPELRGSKLASVNGNMLIKRPMFGIGDMKLRTLSIQNMAVALPRDLETPSFVEEKIGSSTTSPTNEATKKKSTKKQQTDSNQSGSNRTISQSASSLMTNARERVEKLREAKLKPKEKFDYSSSISLEFAKPTAKENLGGKLGSVFGNLVAGAAGLNTKSTAALFLDVEMSDHATSIKEQYMLMCTQQRTNPKSSLVHLISTFGKQHSHNLNFTGYGLSDADFDAATVIFQNLTTLNSLHLHGNRLSTKSVTKFLDVVGTAGAANNLQHVDVSGVNFDLASVQVLLELKHLKALPLIHFIANDCTMGDPASSLLFEWLADGHCKTLTVLHLASNQCSSLFCRSVVRFSRRFSTLETLNLSWNHIREHSAIALVRDLVFFKNLTNLNLSWNGLGEAEVLDAFATVMPRMSLKSLDLSFSRIDHEVSLILCDAIRFSTTIQYLNLAGNPLRMIGARNVISAIVDASQSAAKTRRKQSSNKTDELMTIKLNITSCSVGVVTGQNFDSENPYGEHNLDFQYPFARSRMRAITRMVQRGVANIEEFQMEDGPKTMDTKLISLNPSISSNSFRGDVMIGIPTEGTSKIHVILRKRNMNEHIMDPHRFEVIKNILKGTRKEQRPEVLRMITAGTAFFKYINEIKILLELCEDDSEKRILVGNVMGKVLSARPPPPAVVLKTEEDDEEFFSNVAAPSQAAVASALLPAQDIFALITEQKRNIPAYIRMFTVNNATGYYLIDLENPVESEFLDRLFSVQLECAQAQWVKDMKNRNGMLPINHDKRSSVTVAQRCFNRVFHDKIELFIHNNLIVPKDGKLEIDFFDLRLPSPGTLSLPPTVIFDISQMDTPSKQLKAMRLLSNDYCFSLESCCALLATLPQPSKQPGFGRVKKRRKSISNAKRRTEDNLKTQAALQDLLVVEMVIIMWSRVKERHGVGYLMKFLSLKNQQVVTRRLGAHNIFDLVAAVGLYELDLANYRHRYVAAELVRMAALEPGINMVDCQYKNDNFEVPKSWTQDLPGRGSFVVHYCRSQQVQYQVLNGLKPSGYLPAPQKEFTALNSFPSSWDVYQPVGDDWVESFKKERIRLKILSKFVNAKAVFKHIDTDGGGSIDRRELHAGFLSVRIYLHPYESVALFRVIDEDESGDIDIGSYLESILHFTNNNHHPNDVFFQAN